MLRGLAVVATTALVVALSTSALAQGAVELLEPMAALLAAESDTDLVASLEAVPTGGAQAGDESGDFEHMTGESPRFTPNYVDIQQGALFDLRPGPTNLFGSTNNSSLWPPSGHREIETDDHPTFHTYSGNIPQDGSQYGDGALMFEIGFREPPPPRPGGRCDFMVWVNDPSRGNQFQNLPAFPLDPAAGSNLAFGLRLNPAGGGIPTTFSLATDASGVFHPSEADVRAVLVDDKVGIMVPRNALTEVAAVNYYAVCWTGDSAVDPATSGADQTGSIPTSLSEAGVIALEVTPVVATPTTATEATTATTPAAGSIPEDIADAEAGVPVWAPAAAAAALLGTVAYWVVARRRNPEERAFAAWRKAERDLAKAEVEAEPVIVASLQAGAGLEELEHERLDLCRVWPPVCLTDEETDDADGLSTHDRHFRRMALGELWADYQEGKIGVDEVEARWRQVDTPEFRDRMRESNHAYQETLAQLDKEIAEARAAGESASAQDAAATARMDSAREAVVAARMAYLDTVEGSTEPMPAASRLTDECHDETSWQTVPDGPAERIRVNVGFMLTVGRFAGRERNLERGERMVMEMEGLLNELGLSDAIGEARRGGLHAGWSGHEYEPGVYWLTSDGLVRGGSGEAPDPDAEIEPEPAAPGSMPSLSHFPASIADHATSRVTGWMTGFETLTMQRTFFHQLITSTPHTVWECRDGQWRCRERVWRIEVGAPLRNRGEVRWFSAESPARRAQFETELNRVAWVATGVVTRDLRRLLRWRDEHAADPRR